MSLRSFTMLAQSLRKIRNLDLRPARIHSLPRPCRFASHVVAREQTLTVSPRKARCGRLPGGFHPLPAGQRQIEARENGRLRYAACQSGASFSGHLQISVYVKRHLSRIFPRLTRSLASVLIPRPAAAARLCFALRAPYGLRLSENLFGKTSAQNADEKIFRTFRRSAAWPWERGTLASLRA